MKAKNFLRTLLALSALAVATSTPRFDFERAVREQQREVEATARGLYSLLEAFFVRENVSFALYTYRDRSERFLSLVNEIGRLHEGVQLSVEELRRGRRELRLSVPGLLLVDDDLAEGLVERVEVSPRTSHFFRLLLYCAGCVLRSALKYVHVVNDGGGRLTLTRTEMFADAADCRRPKRRTLNQFDKRTLAWERPLTAPPALRSFNGCPVNVAVQSHVWLKYESANLRQVEQMFGGVLRVMAQIGNFAPNYTVERVEYSAGSLIKSSDVAGIDFKMSEAFQVSTYQVKNFEGVLTFINVKIVLAPTAGELYTQYEKLLLPFDETTWILLVTVFGVAFFVIFVTSFMPKKIQQVIYGKGISGAWLNVIGAFFGIGQPTLPRKNFARIILILFVWFCLIFRTAHQSKLFEYITSEPRRPPPRNGHEALDRYITLEGSIFESLHRVAFQVHSTMLTQIKELNIFSRMHEMQQKFCSQHNNGSAKTIFAFNYFEDFLPVKRRCKATGHLLEDVRPSFLMGMNIDRDSPFYEVYVEAMMRIVPAGIPQKFYDDISEGLQVDLDEQGDAEPKVLTLDDLGFGFVIVVFASGFASICFLLEFATWPLVIVRRKKMAVVAAAATAGSHFGRRGEVAASEKWKKVTRKVIVDLRERKGSEAGRAVPEVSPRIEGNNAPSADINGKWAVKQ